MGTSTNSQKLNRFAPLLVEIRGALGDCWTFYEECIDGILDAAAKQQGTAAWFEQMQQLVEGIEEVQLSHEGVLFLLRDMGIHAPRQQSWGEGEKTAIGMYPSPSISPPEDSSGLATLANDDMHSIPAHPPFSMSSLLPLRSRPNPPAIAAWPPPRASTSRTQHEQRQQPVILRHNVLPFDFSATVLPGLTFPKDFRTYHCPRDEIVLTEKYLSPPPNPLRKTSKDPVFFSHPTLKANVAELFGYTVRPKSTDQHLGNSTWQSPPALPYEPVDDDLMAWKKRSEGAPDNKRNEVRANSPGTDTWPPWKSRLDLEM